MICVADDDAARPRARPCWPAPAADPARVRFVERLPYDDTWLRDSGPITLRDGDGFRLLDFHFTAWGGKFEAGLDDRIVATPGRRADCSRTRARERIDFALEGGGIETDGARHPADAPGAACTSATPAWAAARSPRTLAGLAASAPRAVARPRLPRGRRHRRPHRHPRPLRRARRHRLPGLRRSRPTRTTPSCRRWRPNSPRCARDDGQPYRLFPLPWAAARCSTTAAAWPPPTPTS